MFLETVNALDLGPDDPELLLAAANASMVVSLAEIPGVITAGREQLEALLARFLQDVDLKIAESMTTAVDERATEVRTMARELALGEYSAAAALRSTAIMDEVRALRGATAELERERQAAQARDIAAGTSTSAVLGDRGAPTTPGSLGLDPRAFVVLVIAIVLGVFLGAYMTKRSYHGWRPPARHAGGPGAAERAGPAIARLNGVEAPGFQWPASSSAVRARPVARAIRDTASPRDHRLHAPRGSLRSQTSARRRDPGCRRARR